MVYEVVGILRNQPWEGRKGTSFEGKSGLTNKIYVVEQGAPTDWTYKDGSRMTGRKCEMIKVSSDRWKKYGLDVMQLGDTISCYYNKYGSLDEIRVKD